MKLVESLEDLRDDRPMVIAIGTFDGVHRGHLYMLGQARARAREHNLAFGVITLDPPPALVLRPGLTDYQITPRALKVRLLTALEPDVLAVLHFTPQFAALGAAEFIDRLEDGLRLAEFWMGDDFRFGHDREGGVPYLLERAARSEFAVHVVARQGVEAGAAGVSSSAVREAVRRGDVEMASAMLGRPFELAGRVIHGQGRGRGLGYPTANVELPPEQLVPAEGVYAAIAELSGERHAAAVSVGTNPQFNGVETTVEAYLLDFDQDIYGQALRLFFIRHLRGQATFDGLDGLLTQMAVDVGHARDAIMPLLSVEH